MKLEKSWLHPKSENLPDTIKSVPERGRGKDHGVFFKKGGVGAKKIILKVPINDPFLEKTKLWTKGNKRSKYLFLGVSLPMPDWQGMCCSVAKLCPTICDPIAFSMPGFPVLHYLLEFAQTHVHWVGDAIQLSHPLLFPSPPVLNLSQ